MALFLIEKKTYTSNSFAIFPLGIGDRSIYLYYEQIEKGGRLIYCQECGKLVLSRSTTKTDKYCSKCKKVKDLEKQKRYDDKRRGV